MSLSGKTVLITGAALRIGREIALDLAGQGAYVILHYNRSEKPARALKKKIELMGGRAALVKADFSARRCYDHVMKLIRVAYRLSPRIDYLVNNASIFFPTPLNKIREQDFDGMIAVNLKAPFFLAQKMGMRMMRRGAGKIINLVDSQSLSPARDYLPYGIAKAGLYAATRGLAKALAPSVQVNSIAPGPILPVRGMTRGAQKRVTAKTLLKRFGSTRDIAAAVRFLLDGTDYMTGTCLPVDGGSGIYD